MATTRKKTKNPLLLGHLEGISWKVLQEYHELVRSLIRGKSGIYALYRGRNIYYVGLATNLMGRLKIHLRDRHHGSWDRFSVYLTGTDEHIRELEALVLRIVNPAGNRVTGRLKASRNLHPVLNELAKGADADRRASLLGGAVAARRRRRKATHFIGASALAGVSDRRIALRARYRGQLIKATLLTDGTIRLRSTVYPSPSAAAKAIKNRATNGWTFWLFRNPDREWVPLSSLRR